MEKKDEQLWLLARKRARFKKNVSFYLIISGFLWAIWWFTAGTFNRNMDWPWPIWPMLGYGLVIVFQYFEAYDHDKETSTQKEYDKLLRKKTK